jgi:hypothetical protein
MRPVPAGVLGPDTTAAFTGMVERPDGLVILLDPDHTMFAAQPGHTHGAADPHKEEGFDV